MSLSYSIEEDVLLLQSILKCRAHLKVDETAEIHPIKHGITRRAMKEVAEEYWSALEFPNNFPRRSNKGLQHRFGRILYKYGIGELLAESGSEENSTLRIRLLEKILRDREVLNERKRRSQGGNASQNSEETQLQSCEHSRKRLRVATEDIERPGYLMERRDKPSLSESSLLRNDSEYDDKDDGQTSAELQHAKTCEPKIEPKVVEDNAIPVKNTCFELLAQMMHNGEERRRKLEEHYMHMDRVLLNVAEVETANTTPETSGGDQELRAEYMKTLLAKRELELREKELEVREKEKMWSLMEKMLS